MQASSHNLQGVVDGRVNEASMSTAVPDRSAVLCDWVHQVVPSPRGNFWGLSPPNKAPSPQIETWNSIKQLRFCQYLECQAPRTKPPCRNAKLSYWKHSGDGSGTMARVAVRNVVAPAPQSEPESGLKSATRNVTFLRSDSRCGQYVSDLSSVTVWGWSPHFADFAMPLQSTRPLDTHELGKEVFLHLRLWTFQVGFYHVMQPSQILGF